MPAKNAARRPTVLAVTSDHHANSTVSMCPPEGVRLPDGGEYHPSKANRWLWQCWEDYWREVGALVKAHGADLVCVFNGDAVEGEHHRNTQVISHNPETQAYVSDRIFGVPLALKPSRTFIVRGTEAHVGPSGASEEALGRHLKAERDPETEAWSWWRLRLRLHGLLFDFQHHGRQGGRPWTMHGAVGNLAAHIAVEHVWAEEEVPHFAFRSHRHVFGDSGVRSKPRTIQTPAWQLKTGYAHKVAAESIADIGGVIVLLHPDRAPDVRPVLFRPKLPKEV